MGLTLKGLRYGFRTVCVQRPEATGMEKEILHGTCVEEKTRRPRMELWETPACQRWADQCWGEKQETKQATATLTGEEEKMTRSNPLIIIPMTETLATH